MFVRRGVGYSLYCDCPKSSVEVPFVGDVCGQASGLKILLCEGGDVELGARPRNISWCLRLFIDSYSLSLLCALHLFILLILTYMLGLVVCIT